MFQGADALNLGHLGSISQFTELGTIIAVWLLGLLLTHQISYVPYMQCLLQMTLKNIKPYRRKEMSKSTHSTLGILAQAIFHCIGNTHRCMVVGPAADKSHFVHATHAHLFLAVASIVGAGIVFPGADALSFGHFGSTPHLTGLEAVIAVWLLALPLTSQVSYSPYMQCVLQWLAQ